MACEFVRVDNQLLPNVNGIVPEYTPLAAGRRSLSGLLRVDNLAGVGTKRAWRVTLNHLPRADRMRIRDLVLGNTGIRSVFVDTVGHFQGRVTIASDRHEGVRTYPVGPLVWSDGDERLWSDGSVALGSDPVPNDGKGWFLDHGGGSLELRIEEA